MSYARTGSPLAILLASSGLFLGAACGAVDPAGPLELTQADGTTVAGSFVHGQTMVVFEASSDDGQTARLHLDIDGRLLDAELDLDGTLVEDGALDLRAEDKEALIGLRDAFGEAHPELVLTTLHGRFLNRHTDMIADAPTGYRFGERRVDVRDKVRSNTTYDDSEYTTCLYPGSWYTAYYDAGNGGTQWKWTRQANSGECLGRCGAGCNLFDDDIMLDCFEHDTCVDHFGGSVLGDSPNCGDEFDHAVAEYVVTYGAWCPY